MIIIINRVGKNLTSRANLHSILMLVEISEEVTIVTPYITTEKLNSIGTTEFVESQLKVGKTLPVTTYKNYWKIGKFLTNVPVVQQVAQTTSNWVKYSSLFSSTFPVSAFTDTFGFSTCSRGHACSAL